jgi:DNA-binding response OmpR family regulator
MSRILVLDDSKDVLKLIREILGETHEILTATRWSSGLRDLMSSNFDLILLDVKLPGLQGDEIATILLNSVKTFVEGKGPKIVLFSAMDRSALSILAKECGAHGYIVKDFSNLEVLKRKINRMLKRR